MEKHSIRPPVFAGRFYPASKRELSAEIDRYFTPGARKEQAIACVLPHAGYVYSGAVAGATLSRVEPKNTVVLIGPNHTGYGMPFSVMAEGEWETPLGSVPVDRTLACAFVESAPEIFSEDMSAHSREHSLEVELPFLQKMGAAFSIVPLTIASGDERALARAGAAIGAVVRERGLAPKTLIVASSDMSHYESRQSAEKKDRMAIDAVLDLDPGKLLRVVSLKAISMCGYAPVAVMLGAARALGATKAELVKYATSGDATGDYSSVVGYAGIIIS